MKAIVLHELTGPDGVSYDDIPNPVVQPDEMLVRVRGAALNRRDVFITHGQYPGVTVPGVLGSDGSGVVEASGSDVDGSTTIGEDVVILPSLEWGDDQRVQSRSFTTLGIPRPGTFAELVAVPASNVFPKPSHLSHLEEAALPLAALTAYRALVTRGRLQPGERVLVPGAGGGVASFCIQIARAMGAEPFVTSGDDTKIATAMKLGAVQGVNHRRDGWPAELKKRVGTFDLVVDSVGGQHFEDLVRLTRPGGRIVVFGASAGPVPQLTMPHVFLKQIDILGTSMGTASEFGAMLKLFTDRALRPHLSHEFDLRDTGAALRLLEAGGAQGKVALRVP